MKKKEPFQAVKFNFFYKIMPLKQTTTGNISETRKGFKRSSKLQDQQLYAGRVRYGQITKAKYNC